MASTEESPFMEYAIVIGERLPCRLIEDANECNSALITQGLFCVGGSDDSSPIVKVICKNGAVRNVHRDVLKSISPRFEELMGGEKTIELNFASSIFDSFLTFILTTREIPVPCHLILEIYAAARYFNVEGIIDAVLDSFTATTIEDFLENEERFSGADDHLIDAFADILESVYLGSEERNHLLNRVHRWGREKEGRAGAALKFSEAIFAHEILPGARLVRTSTVKCHLITHEAGAKRFQTYRSYSNGITIKERRFESYIEAEFNDRAVIMDGYLVTLKDNPEKLNTTIQTNRTRTTLRHLAHAEFAPPRDRIWELASSKTAVYVRNYSTVYKLCGPLPLDCKFLFKSLALGVLGFKSEDGIDHLAAPRWGNTFRQISFLREMDGKLISSVDTGKNRDILAISEKYFLERSEETIVIHGHDFKKMRSSKEICLSRKILAARIDGDHFFVKVIDEDGFISIVCLNEDRVLSITKLPGSKFDFLSIVPSR